MGNNNNSQICTYFQCIFFFFFANPHPHWCASREHLCTSQLFCNKYLSIHATCFLQDFSPPPPWDTIACPCLWGLCTPEILHVVVMWKKRSGQWVRCLFQESVCGGRCPRLEEKAALCHASPSGHCCLSQGWAFKQSLLRAVQLTGPPKSGIGNLASSLS